MLMVSKVCARGYVILPPQLQGLYLASHSCFSPSSHSVKSVPLPDSLQAVDKAPQRRSRGAQRLNVRRRVRFASSLAAALLDGLSEQPAMASEQVCEYPRLLFLSCSISLSLPSRYGQYRSLRSRSPSHHRSIRCVSNLCWCLNQGGDCPV